jgi:hypothetical protein
MSTTISNLNIVNSIDVNQNLSCPGIQVATGARNVTHQQRSSLGDCI